MGNFSDSTAKGVHVFTEILGSFRQSIVQVSVPSWGQSVPPLGPWPREWEVWLDTHWQDCTCFIPLLEIILKNLGGRGVFFFNPSSSIDIFKIVVKKLTKSP